MREQHPVAVFDYSHLAEVQTGAVLDLVALQEAHVQAAGKSRMISFIILAECNYYHFLTGKRFCRF